MDIGTLAGLLMGFGFISWAISLGGDIKGFLDAPSVMITCGGAFAATVVSYPLPQLFGVAKVLRKAFTTKVDDPSSIIELLVSFAEKARREGLLSLEEDAEALDDEFLKKGIQLVVDGTDPELVRTMMETELAFLEERHRWGQNMFETMGALAPAYGMIGTLIGLIQMLRTLDDPKKIGPGMAVAIVTTFYGAVLANLVFLPVASRLKVRTSEEILLKEVIIEGILSIQSGDNPRIVEEKLKSF
ncbi:MAG: MotA/TolQ/ExbB proton channel family protein, partial [Firmicutes bacterium]|nr:MotA/TolQ/ExbB proton channel family protein [Bacillota bacterium]